MFQRIVLCTDGSITCHVICKALVPVLFARGA
jgi:hypothetical protein